MKQKSFFISFVVFIFIIQASLFSVANAATRIMPLGDSITQGIASGEPVEDRQVSYRKALWDKLIAAGYDVDFVGSEDAGNFFDPPFDSDNAGFPGIRDDQMVTLLNSGINPHNGEQVAPGPYLESYPADIILLHIGTNGIDTDPNDVAQILDVIDNYSPDTWVIVARIINWSTYNPTVTLFNDNVEDMVDSRVNNPADPAYPDKIIFGVEADMEDGAGIDYDIQPAGDMFDNLHPYQYGTGYDKMADVWYSTLVQILPDPDPDPPNNPSNSNSDSGCFIGTVAYDLNMELHTKAPGDFHDHFLHITFVGRTFVDLSHSIRHLRLISTLDVFIK